MITWRRSRTTSGLIVGALCFFITTSALAGGDLNRSAARDLGYEGVEAYQAGDYATALEKLTQAQEVLPAPSLTLWKGRAQEKNGLWVEAAETYLEATRADIAAGGDRSVQIKAQEEAEKAREALLPKIPKLVVKIVGAEPNEVRLEINGEELPGTLAGRPLPANPGELEVIGRQGEKECRTTAELREGESTTITLDFDQAAGLTSSGSAESAPLAATEATPADSGTTSGSWQPVAGWIGVGTGVAFIGAGAVTGLLTLATYKDLGCDKDGNCPADASDESRVSTANTLRVVSPVMFIAGGVLAAAGVTLLLTAPDDKGPEVAAYVGLNSAGLKGTF